MLKRAGNASGAGMTPCASRARGHANRADDDRAMQYAMQVRCEKRTCPTGVTEEAKREWETREPAPAARGHAARDLQSEMPHAPGIPCDTAERPERHQREADSPQDVKGATAAGPRGYRGTHGGATKRQTEPDLTAQEGKQATPRNRPCGCLQLGVNTQ